MEKFGVVLQLEKVHEARAKWSRARREFDTTVDRIMAVLLHEAARNFMSVDEVAKASGLPKRRVRDLMRRHNLNPRDGKTMLAKSAAKALAENADLLGVKPHEIDLTSPLAYLPMGEQMRRELQEERVARVAEFPETRPRWHYEAQHIDGDEFHCLYKGDEEVAVFNSRDECMAVLDLWNGQ